MAAGAGEITSGAEAGVEGNGAYPAPNANGNGTAETHPGLPELVSLPEATGAIFCQAPNKGFATVTVADPGEGGALQAGSKLMGLEAKRAGESSTRIYELRDTDEVLLMPGGNNALNPTAPEGMRDGEKTEFLARAARKVPTVISNHAGLPLPGAAGDEWTFVGFLREGTLHVPGDGEKERLALELLREEQTIPRTVATAEKPGKAQELEKERREQLDALGSRIPEAGTSLRTWVSRDVPAVAGSIALVRATHGGVDLLTGTERVMSEYPTHPVHIPARTELAKLPVISPGWSPSELSADYRPLRSEVDNIKPPEIEDVTPLRIWDITRVQQELEPGQRVVMTGVSETGLFRPWNSRDVDSPSIARKVLEAEEDRMRSEYSALEVKSDKITGHPGVFFIEGEPDRNGTRRFTVIVTRDRDDRLALAADYPHTLRHPSGITYSVRNWPGDLQGYGAHSALNGVAKVDGV